MQASPNDPDNFPFVVLGNKVDFEGGKNRQVRFSVLCLCRPICTALHLGLWTDAVLKTIMLVCCHLE